MTSYPSPYRIKWYFKGKRIRNSSRVHFKKKHRHLTLGKTVKGDFGTYICIAENSMGKRKFKIQLETWKDKPQKPAKTNHVNEVLGKDKQF